MVAGKIIGSSSAPNPNDQSLFLPSLGVVLLISYTIIQNFNSSEFQASWHSRVEPYCQTAQSVCKRLDRVILIPHSGNQLNL